MTSNSLLNYFKKVDTPKRETPSKPKMEIDDDKENKENLSVKKEIKNEKKRPKDVEDMELDGDEEIVRPPKSESKLKRRTADSKDSGSNTKRRRIMLLSDSEQSEEEKDDKNTDSDVKTESEIDSEEEEEIKKRPKKTVVSRRNLGASEISSPKTPKTPKTPKASGGTCSATCSPATKSALSSYSASSFETETGGSTLPEKFKHYSYAFLEEDKIKDINGRPKSDPEYDPKTIYVPPEFKKTLTPALRQWWELKTTNFDVIFFFKVGKFYELYHMDAVVAVKELGLTFMKGDYAHCGFPEIAFSRFADALVSKGYKVGRVEQTETPEEMTERTKGTKLDKTVRREICRITTPGTKTFNILDSDVSNAFSSYLFSIVERVNSSLDKKTRTYGICFVDTSVGKIHIGQFEDDRNCSKFRTTLAQFPPSHILYERNNLSKETKHIVDLQNCVKDGLTGDKEMYSAPKLLKLLTESNYFKEKEQFSWPESFKTLLSPFDTLGLTPKAEYDLALTAMGGVVWCLKNCLIDEEILTSKNFEIYEPVDNIVTSDLKQNEIKKAFNMQKYMVLDSISLTNLEIIENNYDNSQSGTLYEKLDFCNTAFGKRLLKCWMVNPLCDPDLINDRLDAIEDLKALDEDKIASINDLLKSLPDLERLVSKIHQLGNVNKDHPDSRAIMYENDTYSKRKVEDFILILSGFATASKLLHTLDDCRDDFKSTLLKTIVTITKSEKSRGFPFLDDLIKYYHTTFDAEKAKRDGKIIPSSGVNEEYDTAIEDIKNIEKEFESYLKKQSKLFGCTINYFGSSRNRYQLEIPESKCKHVPDEYELVSSKKGFKRYWTDEIKSMLSALSDAEDRRDQALRNTMKCLFKNFDNHFVTWNRAVQCLAILDVLLSMTCYVKNSEHEMCRPEIVMPCENEKPFVEIINGKHPCLTKTFTGDFIPNDVVVGCQDANNNWQKSPLVIITGPNMGGKSTLMRQTGLTVILAQMGCYVPAEKCRLTPVDRIFTRIGASDKIMAGESTFFLELSETASILNHATKHSLVLMDELGRGTATFDGTAIAYSVVKELAQRIKCRSLFSTHYHHLVEEFSDKDDVSMGHMQSVVSEDDQGITFLYKFGEGACPKSHGFNAARLADIPDEIIKIGSVKSVEFENFSKRIQLLKKLMHSKSKNEVVDVISKFQSLST